MCLPLMRLVLNRKNIFSILTKQIIFTLTSVIVVKMYLSGQLHALALKQTFLSLSFLSLVNYIEKKLQLKGFLPPLLEDRGLAELKFKLCAFHELSTGKTL